MGTRRRRRSRVRPHLFVADLTLTDPPYVPVAHRRAGLGPLRWCARCGLPGAPDDDRHRLPARDRLRLAESAELADRITR